MHIYIPVARTAATVRMILGLQWHYLREYRNVLQRYET